MHRVLNFNSMSGLTHNAVKAPHHVSTFWNEKGVQRHHLLFVNYE